MPRRFVDDQNHSVTMPTAVEYVAKYRLKTETQLCSHDTAPSIIQCAALPECLQSTTLLHDTRWKEGSNIGLEASNRIGYVMTCTAVSSASSTSAWRQ